MYFTVKIEHEIPVIAEYDVIVVGGGPAGVSAAVSSARVGAKTALVERYGYLGGQATGGLVILLVGLTDGKERIIKGFCEETIQALEKLNSTQNIGNHVLFDPESMKYIFDGSIRENSITPYYHSFVSDVVRENGKVCGVVLEGKSGKRVLKAKMFVDATGDADLAKFADIAFEQRNKTEAMPVTLGFRTGGIDTVKVSGFIRENYAVYQDILRYLGISTKMGGWIHTVHKNEAWFNISNIENIDITNPDDLTQAEIIGRKQIQDIIEKFKKEIPGFEDAYLIDTASQIGVRESRRVKGLYYFTKDDVTGIFSNAVCLAPDYTRSGKGFVQVPFECLITKDSDNIIFGGRCISFDYNLQDMFREIPCCMATGQAAGVSAAVAVKNSCTLHGLNIKDVQQALEQQGVILSKAVNSMSVNERIINTMQ